MKNIEKIANSIVLASFCNNQNDDFDERLARNENPVKILQEYYASIRYANQYFEKMRKEAFNQLAFAPVQFFKDLAEKLKIKLVDILRLFKDSKIVKFFSKIGWSFTKLYNLLKEGWKNLKGISEAIREFIEQNKISKFTVEQLKNLDVFLKRHSRTKHIVGIGVAGVLLFIWFFMSYSGDPSYDFDMSDIFNALSGNYSFIELFSGSSGIKLLTLFATGTILKISFPWPGPNNVKFMLAIVYTLADKIRQRLRKDLNPLEGSESYV